MIEFTADEITRLNREYEKELQDKTNLSAARMICGLFAEKSESGQIADGKKYVELLTGVLR